MKKTLKRIGVGLLLTVCVMAFSSCMKKNLIDTYDKTYAVYTKGNSDFFKDGGQFQQMVGEGKTNLYIDPSVYVVTGYDDPYLSSYSDGIAKAIAEGMEPYGYTVVSNEDDADFIIKSVNIQLWYSYIVWTPSSYLDPYLVFWGGYYPWLPAYNVSVASNVLRMDMVEAESLRKYRDWYKNTWLPSNPGTVPGKSHVPADCKVTTVWEGEVIGELEDKVANDNTRILLNLPSAFVQSSYLDTNF